MRGQAHTLEAFTAAVLIIGGLLFATQATAVTPLSASTSNQHIENQQQASIEGLLSATAANGTLSEAVLYWDAQNETFAGTPDRGTYAEGPPNAFGEALNDLLLDRRIAFNVNVRYPAPNAEDETDVEEMVRMGEPSANAVAATRSVGLYDGSNLSAPDDDRSLEAVQSDPDAEFYAPETDTTSRLYTVVEVEVVAWRK
ncbi:DUF7288 family protein [Natronomonas salsuginis]|jgi:hypothetical protein|uniref:Uncharacterized protein n=1 Tax=Natronomonas salsuginis TaxID=2217661 RepID=A0A4U5JP85_9EURY|nr:hypothetical protein [Natronomonas salsuginis]TKR28019.1 hypothetical protein DM868_02755 [Natronomonas salsuginis]